MENENNNQLTNKNQVAQDEIKDLKAKVKGNIYLIEARKIVWIILSNKFILDKKP